MKSGCSLWGILVWCCLLAPQVQGVPILLASTGASLPEGAPDPWYHMVSGPRGAGDLYVVRTGGFPFPLWTPDLGTSAQWIAPHDDYRSGMTELPGTYEYQLTFDLTGLDPLTARLTGEWASDNCGEIYLNGQATGQTTGDLPTCLTEMSPFTISSGFAASSNTLVFRVANLPGDTGNPTGIIVSISGAANEVPEPVTLTLLGCGLAGLWLLRRRNRKA